MKHHPSCCVFDPNDGECTCGTARCTHPQDAIRGQRPGAGEEMQPNLCIQCGQEVPDPMHTPGPWKVIKSPHGPKYRCVQIGPDDTYTTLEMMPADANLIAAAPELLALLRELIDIEGPQPGHAMWAYKVKQAIDKATKP